MVIVEINPLSNGAHRNQIQKGRIIRNIPEGWAAVPVDLEDEAVSYLPFINLTVVDGEITGVAQGTIPQPEPTPEPEPTAEDDLMEIAIDHEYRIALLELGLSEN